MPATILFISANPRGTTWLDLDEEYRAIADEKARAMLREAFDLRAAPAARVEDFRRSFVEHRPAVVHFSGHGGWLKGGANGGGGRDLLLAEEGDEESGHTSSVTGVAVTPDGRFAVSASGDKTLRVWDLDTGKALRTLQGHTSSVTGVAVSPDGRLAVSASGDKTLKVWDLATGQPVTTLETHAPLHSCAITPDGRTILAGDSLGALHILDWRNPPRPRS